VAHLPSTRSSGPGLAALLGVALGACTIFGGCGAPDDRPPRAAPEAGLDVTKLTQYDSSTADSRDVFASGGCEEGATQVCRIYLPRHDDVQPCFVGEQECTDAAWGKCGSAVLVDANADDAEIQAETLEP
jgi:hypothetical protein